MPEKIDAFSLFISIFFGGGIFVFILTLIYQRWVKKKEKVIETRVVRTELINPEISNLISISTSIGRSRMIVSSAYKYMIFVKKCWFRRDRSSRN